MGLATDRRIDSDVGVSGGTHHGLGGRTSNDFSQPDTKGIGNVAEIVVKVGDRSARANDYKDGDVLCAFNQRAIRCCHAQHICHPRIATRNRDGLILTTEVIADWYEATHFYRFERISRTEVRRVIISTGASEEFDGSPNVNGEYMDVELYVSRRKARSDHRLFGIAGSEVWYGGIKDMSDANMTTVWTAIETKTAHREASYTRWPHGRKDIRDNLFIATNDFTDVDAEGYVSAEVDETDPDNPIIITQRTNRVDWKSDLGLTAGDEIQIMDKRLNADMRERATYDAAVIVKAK